MPVLCVRKRGVYSSFCQARALLYKHSIRPDSISRTSTTMSIACGVGTNRINVLLENAMMAIRLCLLNFEYFDFCSRYIIHIMGPYYDQMSLIICSQYSLRNSSHSKISCVFLHISLVHDCAAASPCSRASQPQRGDRRDSP